MSRGFKVLITVLVLVIFGLALTSGFLYSKTTVLEKQLSTETSPSDDKTKTEPTTIASPSVIPMPSATVSPTPTPAISTTSTPTPTPTVTATPGTAGTYTVKAGDTMYSIALGLKINWLDLAKANGLDETTANKIKIGQVLVLPK